ncbi:unnamed protein product [Spirodela intermedia]|uniref:Uncharacterized protein n=1 Tax=Spirodela intermedia TaxID=51605 RepID=A0ABN7E852_SPIIN|nr:unnamed protein product [Spirodela intermedia]
MRLAAARAPSTTRSGATGISSTTRWPPAAPPPGPAGPPRR